MSQSKNNLNTNINYIAIEALEKQTLYDELNDTNLLSEEKVKKTNKCDNDQSRKIFIKELKEVIENSDVVLEVLDSRDPLSCRSLELENFIKSQKDTKKIVLILNKVDLIPM